MQDHRLSTKNMKKPLVGLVSLALSACALQGCSNEMPAEAIDFGNNESVDPAKSDVVLADFVMHVSPKNKKVTIERLVRDQDGVLRPQSIDDLTLSQDGVVGSGPSNTVELVTNSYNEDAACPSGSNGVWCANVTIRHFYTRPLANVFVQVTSIDLANHAATNSDGSEFGLDDTKGLWKYTAAASTNPGVLGMSPHNNGARDWEFNDPDGAETNINLRVVASLKYASYGFDSSPLSYIDACSGGTNLGTASTGTTTLPWGVTLYNTTNTKVNFSRRGVITLGSTSAPPLGNNVDLPSASTGVRPGIFAFWDELVYDTGGALCHKTIGSAPNRQFVVTWKKMKFAQTADNGPTVNLTFSAVIDEGTDKIHFLYNTLDGANDRANGSSATVGVQNETGTEATDESNTASFFGGDAYALIPVP